MTQTALLRMFLAVCMRIIAQCLKHVRKCKWKNLSPMPGWIYQKYVNKYEISLFMRPCEMLWEEATRWIAVGYEIHSHIQPTSLNTWLKLRRFGSFPAAPASCGSWTAFRTQPCTLKKLIRFVVHTYCQAAHGDSRLGLLLTHSKECLNSDVNV